jgi:hypothetical protein
MKNNDPIIITYEGKTVEGRVVMVNKFDKAGFICFSGMLGGYVTFMPIMTDDEGNQTDLMEGKPIKIEPYVPRMAQATLLRHSTADGLVTMCDDVPIGKQYEVDLNTIRLEKMVRVDTGEEHEKEVISILEDGKHQGWMATELLFIPGHT